MGRLTYWNEWFAKAKENSALREQEKRALLLQAHADAERAEVSGIAGVDGAAWMHGRDEWARRMDALKPKLAVVLEVPQRKCQSQWDGNCDRSAFQTRKASALVAEGPKPEWQVQVDPELFQQ